MRDFLLFSLIIISLNLQTVSGDGKCISTGRKYNSTVSDAFSSKISPNITITCDPYTDKQCPPVQFPSPYPLGPTPVCAINYTDSRKQTYVLINYPDVHTAQGDGAYVTHDNPCGVCSTLQDLAVYMKNVDLTAPVRKCGIEGIISKDLAMTCLRDLGFTESCASVWFDNTVNTRKNCFGVCIVEVEEYYNNQQNCSLNMCLQCDEDISGPVFKKYAGRTRRDSGLFSAIWRPPDTIYDIVHDYY